MGAGASCCGLQKLEEASKYAETDDEAHTRVEDSARIPYSVTKPIEEVEIIVVQEDEPEIFSPRPVVDCDKSHPSVLDFETSVFHKEKKVKAVGEMNIPIQQDENSFENSMTHERDAGDISLCQKSDRETSSETDRVKTGMTGDWLTSVTKSLNERDKTEGKRRRRVKDKDKRTVDKIVSRPRSNTSETIETMPKKISSETSETIDIKEGQSSSDSCEDLPIAVDLDGPENVVLSDKYVKHVAERILAGCPVQDQLDMVPLSERRPQARVDDSGNVQNEEIISGTDHESEISESESERESERMVERRFENSIDDWDSISELASEKMHEPEKPSHELDVSSLKHQETAKQHCCMCSNGIIRGSHRLSRNMNHKSESTDSLNGISITSRHKESQWSRGQQDNTSLSNTGVHQVPSEKRSQETSLSGYSQQKPADQLLSRVRSDDSSQEGNRRWTKHFKPLIYNPSDTVQPYRCIGHVRDVSSWHMVDGYYIPGSPTVLSVRTEASCSPEAAKERRAIEQQEAIWCWGRTLDKSNACVDANLVEQKCVAAEDEYNKDDHKDKSIPPIVVNQPDTVHQCVSSRSVLLDSDDWVLSERRLQLWMENSRLHSRRSGNKCLFEHQNGAINCPAEHQSSNQEA